MILEAELLAQNNDLDSAAAVLEEVISKDKDNIEALQLLASVYTAQGRTAESSELWQKISILDPSDPEAAYETGVALAGKGDWTALRERMLAAEAAGAADKRHYLLLGEADLELGYKGEAESYLAKASDLARAQYLLGELYYSQGKSQKAEAAFREVLRHEPGNGQAHLHLGWLTLQKGLVDEAMMHYSEAARLNPKDPLARLSYAALLEKSGRPQEAIEQYRAAVTLQGIPRDKLKEAYNSLTRLLVTQRRHKEALAAINRGLEEFPSSGGLYFQWGELLLDQGKRGEAKEKFKRAADDPVWRKVALHRYHSI